MQILCCISVVVTVDVFPPFFCHIFVYTIFFVYRHNKNQKNMDLFKFVPIEKNNMQILSVFIWEEKTVLFCVNDTFFLYFSLIFVICFQLCLIKTTSIVSEQF